MTVRKRDGVHFEAGGRTVVADARSATGDVTVVSHAHADHLPSAPDDPVVCSETTAALAAARADLDVEVTEPPDGVTLLPSGHVVGSRAVLVEADRRYLYTGDVSTRDRAYLAGFDPPDADVLVVEATYGRPAYRFPPQDDLERAVADWLADAAGRPVALFGYSLGRAQKLQALVREVSDRRVVVHPAVADVNAAVESATDLAFPAVSLADIDEVEPGDAVVAPPAAGRRGRVADLRAREDVLTAGFSGWAVDDAYVYRTGYDAGFVLTDHCDFDELVALVEAVDPEAVYTHHGFAEDLAGHLSGRLGYDATALKRGQRRLDEF